MKMLNVHLRSMKSGKILMEKTLKKPLMLVVEECLVQPLKWKLQKSLERI